MTAFRRQLASVVVLSCLLAASHSYGFAAATSEKFNAVSLYGSRYVSLHQWARVKGFTLKWDKPGKQVELGNQWTKLSFTVNSKRATINNITVWLCTAVAVHREALYISERDLQKTIHPLLYPEKLPKGKKVRTIVIAAGHGGKDPGNMVNKAQEKKYTLLLAKALKDLLRAKGFNVVMTRDTDIFVDLEPQAAIANRAKADLFVALHYNAVADVAPKGLESFSLTPAGATSTNGGEPSAWSRGNKNDSQNVFLAYLVHKAMVEKTQMEDRGIRRARFMVLREINMPGILVEGGFMSNASDAQKIYSATHRKVAAQAIADAIVNYKRLVERN